MLRGRGIGDRLGSEEREKHTVVSLQSALTVKAINVQLVKKGGCAFFVWLGSRPGAVVMNDLRSKGRGGDETTASRTARNGLWQTDSEPTRDAQVFRQKMAQIGHQQKRCLGDGETSSCGEARPNR